MAAIGTLISFNDFIKGHNVEIPRIQRDYTYGSATPKTEEVVDKLLSDINAALTSPDGELILDFVYGSSNDKGNFEPLDGQQRLTTLFLLYLYAAWGAGVSTSSLIFRYSTRDNTTVFCESITDPGKFHYNKDGDKISEQIKDCAFFRSSFQDDPSIRSMLVVLDKIEKKFKDLASGGTLWNLLNNGCHVKFYCLDFGKFGLSDDLYIKMNSRGKGLTDYEIFKSQLEKHIDITLNDKDLMYDVAKKFDTDYTDLVWSEQHYDKNKIDDSFVNLFRNLLSIRNFKRGNTKYLESLPFLADYIPPKNSEKDKVAPSWYIGKEDVQFIIDFLDTFHTLFHLAEKDTEGRSANDIFWNSVFYQDDSILGEPNGKIRLFTTDINLFRTACNKMLRNPERIMFYAQYYALRKHAYPDLFEDSKKWDDLVKNLRHIRNLVENSDDELSRPDYIAEMLSEVETILDGGIMSLTKSRFNTNQFQEELAKSKEETRWANLYKYEEHDLLRGSLSLMAPDLDDRPFAIDDDTVLGTLTSRLDKICWIFDNESRTRDHFIRAALLSHGDYGQISRSDIKYKRDCYMYGRMPASWRLLLTKNRSFDQSKILSLIDSIETNKPLAIGDLPTTEWRYYATRNSWYEQTYYSYNYAKYGYYFFEDQNRPLEVFLLQSTSCYDDNVMWKLLNWLLEYTLLGRGIVAQGQTRLGDRKTAPELHIMDRYSVDVRQEGWKIENDEFMDTISSDLLKKGYVITERIVEVPAGADFVEFAVTLVQDINRLINETR